MSQDLLKKLRMQNDQKVAIIHAPDSYLERLEPLPEGVELSHKLDGSYDFIQLFVQNVAELEEYGPKAINGITYDGMLWVCYPKKSAKLKTDLSRDHGWEKIRELGYDGIALISLDETWSCMRLRPFELVKTARKSPGIPASAKNEQKEERTLEIPEELTQLLDENKNAKQFFESLSFTNKKEYARWISSAKREETKQSRLQKTIEKLAQGLKNPHDKG